MAKHRTSIPEKLAAHVRWLSDDTCCICTEQEKDIQLHHIDENPSNHSVNNLAVLCLECHNKIHKKGGITRGMTPQFITLCRDKWFETVAGRRKEADEREIERRVGKSKRGDQSKDRSKNKSQHTQLSDFPSGYIRSLPKYKSDLIQQINKQQAGGSTPDIIEANSHYANALKGILVTLASFYSSEYFNDKSPQEFFSEIISERSRFHVMIAEPHGRGTGGTISGINRGCLQIKDIENLIDAMVYGLLYPKGSCNGVDYDDWKMLWQESDML